MKETKVKTEKAVKESKKNEKTAKEQMELEVVKEVVVRKELRYKYPRGMIDTVARKSYRQKVRNKIEKAELKVFRLSGGDNPRELKRAQKELKELQEQYLA